MFVVGAALIPAGRTDGRADMTKLTVAPIIFFFFFLGATAQRGPGPPHFLGL